MSNKYHHVTTQRHRKNRLGHYRHVLVLVELKHRLTLYLAYNTCNNGIIRGSTNNTHKTMRTPYTKHTSLYTQKVYLKYRIAAKAPFNVGSLHRQKPNSIYSPTQMLHPNKTKTEFLHPTTS